MSPASNLFEVQCVPCGEGGSEGQGWQGPKDYPCMNTIHVVYKHYILGKDFFGPFLKGPRVLFSWDQLVSLNVSPLKVLESFAGILWSEKLGKRRLSCLQRTCQSLWRAWRSCFLKSVCFGLFHKKCWVFIYSFESLQVGGLVSRSQDSWKQEDLCNFSNPTRIWAKVDLMSDIPPKSSNKKTLINPWAVAFQWWFSPVFLNFPASQQAPPWGPNPILWWFAPLRRVVNMSLQDVVNCMWRFASKTWSLSFSCFTGDGCFPRFRGGKIFDPSGWLVGCRMFG